MILAQTEKVTGQARDRGTFGFPLLILGKARPILVLRLLPRNLLLRRLRLPLPVTRHLLLIIILIPGLRKRGLSSRLLTQHEQKEIMMLP